MDSRFHSRTSAHLLRSRSRSFGSPPSQHDALKVTALAKTNNRFDNRYNSKTSYMLQALLLSIILLTLVKYALESRYTASIQMPSSVMTDSNIKKNAVVNAIQGTVPSLSASTTSSNPRIPFVDRAILQRLADMEIDPDPDERPYFASSHKWPPIVTRIPEAKKLVVPLPDICGAAPCRFLFPLRISEQESKARMHLMEILQLAQKLDRILVLPNVGKSRIGACFKADFDTYYDLERLSNDLGMSSDRPAMVKMDLFRRWVALEAPTAQLSFLTNKQQVAPDETDLMFTNDDVSIRVGDPGNVNQDLPPCFARFDALRLNGSPPLYIHLKPHARWPADASIIEALSFRENQTTTTSFPTVLAITWDLRHPIFPPTFPQARLHYAPHLHALATALAPRAPYVMVHWRMETVPPAALPQCAHALVDTLTRLPGDVRTIWLASDYPHAVHRSARPGVDFGAAPSGGIRKSGTFRDVGPLHAEAVGILGDAFAEGGELEGWQVEELTDARLDALESAWEPEFLEDIGVRAIVDKIIGMEAMLFVSGASGCARSSSFTKQIVDERRGVLARSSNELPPLHNVVEFFG
ncbi:hypothetical protein B0H15DRAFT_1024696 [Mycena belliarum]|uniref:Uncharacterized protein n=1 Tax=Mycena belliarum TaxID=1033014 RepID=A0AAD6XNA7_9AGAR|nr:hypothetical protein B0H15DRAFT_1024696 [Mycena belliae]